MKRNFLFVFVALAGFACQPTGESNTGQGQGPDSVIIQAEDPLPSPSFGIAPDPERFPYLEVIDDSTTKLQAYTVKFQLNHHYPLAPVTSDKLYWIDETNSNENLGIFLHYFIMGRQVALSATNVRVDYFSKSNPASSEIDSLFAWTDAYFLQSDKARVIKEVHAVPTASGEPFYVRELYSVRADSLTPKFLALGYLDYNDEYMVGINLTAVDSFEYKDALPAYYELVKSFSTE